MNTCDVSGLHHVLAPLAAGDVFAQAFRLRFQFPDPCLDHVTDTDDADELVAVQYRQMTDATIRHAGHHQHHVVVRLTDHDFTSHNF